MPDIAVYTCNSFGELETLKKLRVTVTDELRGLASEEDGCSPQPSVAGTESRCIHPAGKGGVSFRSAQASC